ncbi:hypothetical protein Q31b_37480 [Novipirellula aureliae]|uniref:Uncharacterized protein n=1 Tax=Novipirellula aureliae TaxID=2527966 RepID=A0A5C6DPE4_9BACT|nr:hypothetical protein [Novipirellula aureliae]TWU38670.1 hypothetical protein Q31b_37480 [Novipirellula aureliae]
MKQRKWTKEIVVERLKQWRADGVQVKMLWRQDPAMTSRATSLFGSWRKALAAAGIVSARTQWSRKLVIDRLRLTRGQGLDVDPLLVSAATRYFGTMRAACKAAGVPCLTSTPPHREWDRDKAIEEIGRRHNQGHSLRATAREDPALYAAGKRLFGTWTKARAAAGHPIPGKIVLSAEEVIDAMQKHVADGGSLPKLAVDNTLLQRSARHHFGRWSDAVDAAGFKAKRRQRWDKRSVIAAMRQRHADGFELRKAWREDKSLFRGACRHFGGWRNAMRVAGFEPIKAERWSKQRIIERLRAWAERPDDTDLGTSDQALSSAACRFFGSHEAAFEATGIESPAKRWTKERVVAAIQDRFIAGDASDKIGFGDEKLASAAYRHFGSWPAAVEAAGLIDKVMFKPQLRRWNQQRVIAEIQAWHDSGHRLAEVSRKYGALFHAARTHFGTWNKAVIAADLEPERRFYTKAEILDMIRRRREAGESLSSGHPDVRNLAMLTIRHFGTWRKGLAAAGVVQFGRKKVAS